MLCTELVFWTAAAHGYQPAAAGRFWAVFGLLTPAEQSSYTGRPGVLALLCRPLHESEAAASMRFGDLVTDLVTWAKAQYTTAPAGQQPRAPRHEAAFTPQAAGSAPHHRRSATPLGRRQAAAHAAAAVAPVAGPAGSYSTRPPRDLERELQVESGSVPHDTPSSDSESPAPSLSLLSLQEQLATLTLQAVIIWNPYHW